MSTLTSSHQLHQLTFHGLAWSPATCNWRAAQSRCVSNFVGMLVLKVLGHAAFGYSGTCRETSINVSGGRMENNNGAAVRSISACMSSACYESIAQRRLQLSRVEQYAIHQNTRGGTRTRNLLLRREAPYPLGHTSYEWQGCSQCKPT